MSWCHKLRCRRDVCAVPMTPAVSLNVNLSRFEISPGVVEKACVLLHLTHLSAILAACLREGGAASFTLYIYQVYDSERVR